MQNRRARSAIRRTAPDAAANTRPRVVGRRWGFRRQRRATRIALDSARPSFTDKVGEANATVADHSRPTRQHVSVVHLKQLEGLASSTTNEKLRRARLRPASVVAQYKGSSRSDRVHGAGTSRRDRFGPIGQSLVGAAHDIALTSHYEINVRWGVAWRFASGRCGRAQDEEENRGRTHGGLDWSWSTTRGRAPMRAGRTDRCARCVASARNAAISHRPQRRSVLRR